jgi:hypothetical protein
MYNEPFTEESAFKGLMGMAGCGLLLLGLTMVVLVAIGDAAARFFQWHGAANVLGKWPILLAVLLVLFLLLQLLRPGRTEPPK